MRRQTHITPESYFLRNLQGILEQHLSDEGFDIPELCREAGLSRSLLHKKLKSLTGQSTSMFVRTIRLEKARELLRNTDLNISQVAYRVEFRTPVYFTQVFSEEVGVPPSAFKMQTEKPDT